MYAFIVSLHRYNTMNIIERFCIILYNYIIEFYELNILALKSNYIQIYQISRICYFIEQFKQ